MEIIYDLEGAGWAMARIRDGGRYRDMSVSYLSDALGDMAAATVRLLEGANEATFSFEDEPGEHQWILTRTSPDELLLRIVWFEENFSPPDHQTGVEVFSCRCSVMELANQVLSNLHAILKEVGIEGYKQRWQNHDFPLLAYERLKRLC